MIRSTPSSATAPPGSRLHSGVLSFLAVLAAALSPHPAPAQAGAPVSSELEWALAERFAPVFVFHPDERYLPTSPLFPLSDVAGGVRSLEAQTAVDALGTPSSRAERYRALTPAQRGDLATVYYRAYRSRDGGEDVVVLEYWLYYVQNDYRIRASPLPVSIDASHPNDLEHVHFVLRADLSGTTAVYSSAHEGTMPANRYLYAGGESPGPVRLLVELGSHAMAPDIDRDGRFEPGIDGESGEKMTWGIRDSGVLWIGYDPDFMDPRPEEAAWFLFHSGREFSGTGTPAGERSLTYDLVSVESLEGDLASLGLSDDQRARAFENPRNPFRKLFGADDGSSESLLVPPEPDGASVGVRSPASNESGVLAGSTFIAGEAGVFLGARKALLVGPRYLPDAVLEVDGILTGDGGSLVSQFLASYPLQALARAFAGPELVIDSVSFRNRRWQWIGGIEVRMGHMWIRGAARHAGSTGRLSMELRLGYLF